MATKQEIEAAERAKKKKLVDTVSGTAASIATQSAKKYAYREALRKGGTQLTHAKGIYAGGLVAGAIDFISNIGIAVWQFTGQRKRAKKQEKLTRDQQKVRSGVDGILDAIEETGLQLVDQGVEPGTKEFEGALYKLLFNAVGYRGNCNVMAWSPNTKPGKNRPYMFRVTNNGKTLTPGPAMKAKVPNLQTYWYTRCKNAKDMWVQAYSQKLLAEGRLQELEAFQASLKKGKMIVKVVFGLLFAIMLSIFAIQATRVK